MNNNVKKSLISVTATAAMAVTGLGLSNASSVKADTTDQSAPAVVRTNNASALFRTPSSSSKITDHFLGSNTSWRVAKTVVDNNGTSWYLVGNSEWLSSNDATVTSTTQAVTESAAKTESTQSSAASVISTAKKYLGTPYVWGGKTPSGFDCSGFTSYVYSQATGKSIGGYTVAQESAGTQEAVSQASTGDLLFWGSKGSTYHVGIYLGNNQYIAAPQPGESVKISSISSYFMPSFAVKVL